VRLEGRTTPVPCQAAMKRLTEIGVPALSILENAEESNDLELRLRASALVKSIREANRPSVRVNGMEFTLETDFKWRRPSEVHVTRFNLTVRAKNISDTIYRFGLTKVSIVLTDSTGQSPKALPIWLRGTLLPPIHPAMAKNDALAFSLDASLVKENDNVMLHWNDPLSFSQFGPLADKTYSVALAFESSLPTQNADGSGIRMPEFSDSTYWLGKVQTPSERIQIR